MPSRHSTERGTVPARLLSDRYSLSKPTDDREARAARHRHNFVKRLGGERYQQACLTFETKRPILIIKVEDAAAVTSILRLN